MLATSYTLSTTTQLGFGEAAERVREELKSEGFGVLCEIDVQATLKEKLELGRYARFDGGFVTTYLHKSDPGLPPTLGVLVLLGALALNIIFW